MIFLHAYIPINSDYGVSRFEPYNYIITSSCPTTNGLPISSDSSQRSSHDESGRASSHGIKSLPCLEDSSYRAKPRAGTKMSSSRNYGCSSGDLTPTAPLNTAWSTVTSGTSTTSAHVVTPSATNVSSPPYSSIRATCSTRVFSSTSCSSKKNP